MPNSKDVAKQVLKILSDIADTDKVTSNIDVPLYSSGLLDSLGTISLLLALEREFDVSISPAELDPREWATPRKIVADVERRLAADVGASG